MVDKNILIKNIKRRSYLNEIRAIRIDKRPDETTVDVNQKTKYIISDNSEKNIVIKVNTETFLKPEALFSIEIEHVIELMVDREITDENIHNNIKEIIAPLGAEVSYIIASITKEMIGSHVILPPVLNLDIDDKL